ncbi:MAG: hypothetical protein JSS53_04370 [Proteobacteria bacterium]|nr:hypothetical protein [Pseudomonadota bacterium]
MKFSKAAYPINLEACMVGLEEYISKHKSLGERESAYAQLGALLRDNNSKINDVLVQAVTSHLQATPDEDTNNDEKKVATEALALVILKPFLDKNTFETIKNKFLNQESIAEISIKQADIELKPHHLIALQALFKSITLENLSLSANTVKTLAWIIEKNNPSLKILVLKIRNINALDLTSFSDALKKNTQLETLHIENMAFAEQIGKDFTQENMIAIAKSLASNTGLNSINVQSREILEDDFYEPIKKALADIFVENSTIQNVKFDDIEMKRQHTMKPR